MQPKPILLTLFSTLSSASPTDIYSNWSPPGPNDVRGPCPMLNTLANHNFLPHSGKNLTLNITTTALFRALNFDPAFSTLQFNQGVQTNPIPNSIFFDLSHLSRHNVLEHDASLSRSDDYLGESNILFNETIFAETLSYFPLETISLAQMAHARQARKLSSKFSNPTYTFSSDVAESFSIGETISPFLIFGGQETRQIPKSWLEFWFRHEKFPTHLGFSRPAFITNENADPLQDAMEELSKLETAAQRGGEVKRKRGVPDFHAGRAG